MNRLLFILTLLYTAQVQAQLPKGSVDLGYGIYGNKNIPDCGITHIHGRTTAECNCTLQDVVDNGHTVGFGSGHFGQIYMYENLAVSTSYTVYEGDGASVWYDFGSGSIKVVDIGWDPIGTPGYGYMHLFNPNGIMTISDDGANARTSLLNPATGFMSNITSNATAARNNQYPDEDGLFAINPTAADTLIVHKTDTGTIITYTVPPGGIRKYDISWFMTPSTLSGAWITAECIWYDELGTLTTHSFTVTTLGYNIINNFNIAASPGTNITIHTLYAAVSSPVDYNISATITRIKKG